MSMYRQLWLAIILTTLLSIVGAVLASTYSSCTYLNQQLRNKNTDNANVFALLLSQKQVDNIDLELEVSSMFDNGHFSYIEINDPNGKPIVQRHASAEDDKVPRWFKKLFPISSYPGQAQINSGWAQIGNISLASQTGDAYQILWKSSKDLTLLMCMTGLLAGYLGTIILRRLKKPLQSVVEQAQGLAHRHFVLAPESKVPELKQLSQAMNSTTLLLKTMFSEEAERIEKIRKQANSDLGTGVSNREHFLAQLQLEIEKLEVATAYLLILRISGLANANKQLGRTKTDAAIQKIADRLLKYQNFLPDGLAARLNGTDFGFIFRQDDASVIVERLLNDVLKDLGASSEHFTIYAGYSSFASDVSYPQLMSQVDSAVASAESVGVSNVKFAAPLNIQEAPRNLDEWSALLHQSLENQWVKLDYFPVTTMNGDIIHRESALRLKFGGEWFAAGRFIPIAERLAITAELDVAAVQLALDALQNCDDKIAVNISIHSIKTPGFIQQVKSILSKNSSQSVRLCLEVPAKMAFDHVELMGLFIDAISDTGCEVGLEHFGHQFERIDALHGLHLHYIKIDSSFIRHIDTNDINHSFLDGVIKLIHRIKLLLIAEGVSTQEEFATLKQLEVDGATGPEISRWMSDPRGAS